MLLKKNNEETERETSGETVEDGREVVLASESLVSSAIEIGNHRREHGRQASGQHVGALAEGIVAVGSVGSGRPRLADDGVVFLSFHCGLIQLSSRWYHALNHIRSSFSFSMSSWIV